MVNFIGRWFSRPNRTRMAHHRSQNLRTVVDNRSGRLLIIKDYYNYMGRTGYYGGEKFELRAGVRKKIPSGNFIREYVAYRDDSQEIHFMSGEHVLLTLSHDNFYENEGKVLQLVWDLLDDCLRYAFVDPTLDINHCSVDQGCASCS